MKTASLDASPALSARIVAPPHRLRVLAVGLFCAVLLRAAFPLMMDPWAQAADWVEQLSARAHGPFAPLPAALPARQLAGWNAH